jgi:AcrR family transcriptional regulator
MSGLLSHWMQGLPVPTEPSAGGLAPGAPTTLRIRAVDATLACIARHGLAKLTVDDVAREAGCGRASLYREFGSKRALVAAVVAGEAARVGAAVRDAAARVPTLEDAVVAVLTTIGAETDAHEALQFVAAFEPGLLVPHLTFGGADRFLAWAATEFAPCFERFVGARDASFTAEWIARVALVLWCSPSASTSPVALADPASVRPFVRQFVLPGIDPGSSVRSN